MKRSDRAPMGKAGMTSTEGMLLADRRAEKELQRDMANLLRQRGIWFVRARMDKRHTLPKGTPDFLIFPRGNSGLAVEAKVFGGALSEDQKAVFADFSKKTGSDVHIIVNLQQFRELLEAHGA